MLGCKYISKCVPFELAVGYSYCIYYCVFCSDSCSKCPFDFLPHHLVSVREFDFYPAKKSFIQLSLFD